MISASIDLSGLGLALLFLVVLGVLSLAGSVVGVIGIVKALRGRPRTAFRLGVLAVACSLPAVGLMSMAVFRSEAARDASLEMGLVFGAPGLAGAAAIILSLRKRGGDER